MTRHRGKKPEARINKINPTKHSGRKTHRKEEEDKAETPPPQQRKKKRSRLKKKRQMIASPNGEATLEQ